VKAKSIAALFVLVLAMLLFVSFTGCDSSPVKPEKTSDRVYGIGLRALEVADNFLDGKIDAKEAESSVLNARNEADKEVEQEKKALGVDNLTQTDVWRDYYIAFDLSGLYYDLSNSKYESGSTADVLKSRNSLAKTLGVKER
jgi:hypothetical protein